MPDDVEIKRVEVSTKELDDGATWIEAMKFHDAKGNLLLEIRGE